MTRRCSSVRAFGLWCLLCALLLSGLLSGVSSAAAQVVVLRVDPAAEPLCRALEAALGNQGLVPDPGYFAEARQQNVDPSSDGALTLLVPLMGVRLAVIPQSATTSAALVEFRDGQTGANLGTASIPLDYGGAVGWQGQRLLQLEVQRRLGGPPAAPAPPSAAGATQAEPEAEGDADETEGEASGEDELYLRVFGGAGMAMRNIAWPSAGETLKVETGPFMAVELGASFGLKLSPSFEIGPELVYQTSLDHQITETHIDGAADTLGVRSHRFEALLAFGFLFGDGFRIAPEVGFALRNLRPAVHHLLTPSYTLSGPLLRVSARIPLGDVVAFQLAPEVQYVLVGDAFQELGMNSTGLAFGGQASFEIALSHAYAIELVYREAHALVPSTMGDDASDIERFATARFRWQP